MVDLVFAKIICIAMQLAHWAAKNSLIQKELSGHGSQFLSGDAFNLWTEFRDQIVLHIVFDTIVTPEHFDCVDP